MSRHEGSAPIPIFDVQKWTFRMLIAAAFAVGLLVILYARYYLTPEDATGRFYAYLLLFMGAMLGLVLSENLLQMLLFWELTSLSSFLLIGYWRDNEEARRGARLALFITGSGGLALFAAVLLLAADGRIDRVDGMLLLTGFCFYLYYLFRWGHASEGTDHVLSAEVETAKVKGRSEGRRPWLNWARVFLGMILLLLGADWLVSSAVVIAGVFNVPEEVIGATLVAVGTSVPELASTLAAAIRGLGDIAIGNVIGSNIFNLGLVLGTASMIHPLGLSRFAVQAEVLPALGFCLLLIPLAYTGARVSRAEGGLLLAGYALFIISVL